MRFIKNFFDKVVKFITAFLYPSFCVFCGDIVSAEDVCCDKCFTGIKPLATVELEITPLRKMKVHSLGDYRGSLRSMLMGKFNGDRSASWRLAKLVTKISKFSAFSNRVDLQDSVLVPVPLHWSRLISRGFNQSRIMSDVYSEVTGIPVKELVVRSKRTAYQSLLPKKKRNSNVSGAFSLASAQVIDNFEFFRGKHLIIVDDLCTTGETLRAVAKPLLELKPASISAAVVCRVK